MFVTSKDKRFNRLVFTRGPTFDATGKIIVPGERAMLPYFGSSLHELIDKPMDSEWKISMKKYLFECFFNDKNELWDKDFEPEKIRIIDLDIEKGSIEVHTEFKNRLEVSFGYTV